MALRMTITRWYYDSEHKYHSFEFDVDLLSENELEFVGEDIEAMLAAQALGIDDYNYHLDFYRNYTRYNGFFNLVAKRPRDVYNALEEQGYESFNYGDFSPEDFALILADVVISPDTTHARDQAMHVLENFVDLTGEDTGPFSFEKYQELLLASLAAGVGNVESIIEILHPLYYTETEDDEPTEYDENYVEALISALTHASTSEVETILDELMLYIDEDDVDYTETNVTDPGGWEDDEVSNISRFKHKIEILGKTVFEWDRVIQSEIHDPIGFYVTLTDLSEHSDSFKSPDEAEAILSYFELSESEYDEDDPDAPEPPEHPKSDDDGEFAVLYTRYQLDTSTWEVTEDIKKQILVPYGDESDMNDAIELSKTIFKRGGDEDEWTMTRLERKSEKELLEQEFMARQYTLPDKEFEREPDPIWDEWRIYWEDAEDE